MQRQPIPPLRPFVSQLWASEGAAASAFLLPQREHMLPTGAMHLVIRLTDAALFIGSADDNRMQRVGDALIGGARSRFYVRELAQPSCSVGAVLRPGAALPLFGATADELSERHTDLEALWGLGARHLRERLLVARGASERLTILEAELMQRLPRVHGLHPAVAAVLQQMAALSSVEEVVRTSGLSHRHFIAQFRRAIGLPPKTYLRVLRFQRALAALRSGQAPSLAALAADMGYSDQAHFQRDFVAFAGTTPMTYMKQVPRDANHLPVGGRAAGSDFFNT